MHCKAHLLSLTGRTSRASLQIINLYIKIFVFDKNFKILYNLHSVSLLMQILMFRGCPNNKFAQVP